MDSVVRQLFEAWTGEKALEVRRLSANGSNRQYWRVIGQNNTFIAAHNGDVKENEAFYYYSQAMSQRGIRVPQVYYVDDSRQYYLQEDLGDTTLYSHVYDKRKQGGGFDTSVVKIFKQVLDDLAHIQVSGRNMDFAKAYPRSDFDAQSMQWDLNYFKYYFLKLKHIAFDEELLENDFQELIHYLLEADCGYFMYRDFQSRNIMLKEGVPHYIDFQGGRRGAAQYDVASLLYSAKSDIPEPIRLELLNHYVNCLAQLSPIKRDEFLQHFWGYVYIRIMQAMGAYGYRGYYERKDYFLGSIPLAVGNLKQLLTQHSLPIRMPHLMSVLHKVVDSELSQAAEAYATGLTVAVCSFSYKKGMPQDPTGNGGGFVFDCRALPNPGRYPEFRCYTGKDREVVDFFKGDERVDNFIHNAERIVAPSIEKYMERNFTHLAVGFGCTGGQHRSVYCAERFAEWVKNNYDCQVVVLHREQQQ